MRTANILLATVLLASAISEPSGAETPKLDWLEGDLGLVLNVVGMTFVASEGSRNDILLRAERARFYPEREVAELEQVEVEVASGGDRIGFEMRCDRGKLNLSTRDFLAEGHVVGTIEGGRRFEAQWVAYDEKKGILYTDEPVLIVDEDGRYQGGGFRYFVNEQRFRLQGGATVVQEP
jgi:LPS export ABC transporter protein LptC